MAMASAQRGSASPEHRWKRALLGAGITIVVILALLVVAVLALSGVTLAGDSTALARVTVQPLGGTIERVRAYGPDGRRVPLAIADGRLTPLKRLTPGEQVTVDVEVRRPGWLGWALGSESNQRLTLRAPVAQVTQRWMTVPSGSEVRVSFDQPVSAVSYGSSAEGLTHRRLSGARSSISLGSQASTGAIEIAAAPRPWERLGAPTQVSWFPPSRAAVMVSFPAAGSRISPATPIDLTFSKPVSEVLGSARPQLSPSTPGSWREANSHTLVFTPTGLGAALDSPLRVQLPHAVAVTTGGSGLRTTSQIEWTVPPGSTLRLHQLLAEAGYLPVVWRPAGAPVAHTPSAEARAAVEPPSGSFDWRYPNTPHQLQAMWSPTQASVITKGAVMKLENENDLTVDGLAGSAVWHTLLADAIAGKRLTSGYSYVYVHREVPETMTLWHNGQTIITSPANTGISGAETELGTFPVFEHLPETTMSGTNPDGSHYEDPGIKWVSYFNGGDALHNFDRSSFGTPQSLGCVELPLAASAEIWPYTPIGTL
ncbi:MAG TPA: L,D-transpeptidase, partial [Solirubrobacteraceae bacterium]|nr:L,D-transpeptidase [Solirubrobacteraceae bacterium]